MPGIVRVFSCGQAACDPRPLSATLTVGRATGGGFDVDDDRLSRRHFRVERADAGSGFFVVDEKSRNGTWIDGARTARAGARAGSVVRAGRSVFLLVEDVRAFSEAPPGLDPEIVCGPTLAAALRRLERLSKTGRTLSLQGESGSGKELAARTFHDGAGGGPFIAVNCAAIPEGMAERLLFGTKRGAYSGAQSDAEGWISAADGGTLFLDEVAELDARVQAKLLRVLELGEVTPLGAARPSKVSFRLCVATHKDLREETARGRFREDLFYRVGVDAVRLPALRERREDISVFVVREVSRLAAELEVDASLVDACMQRPWPGNVRELAAEIRVAAREASGAGRKIVDDRDLAPAAGRLAGGARPDEAPEAETALGMPSDDAIARKLRESEGNVTRAARELGLHRNQLRRWLSRRPDARELTASPEPSPECDPAPES